MSSPLRHRRSSALVCLLLLAFLSIHAQQTDPAPVHNPAVNPVSSQAPATSALSDEPVVPLKPVKHAPATPIDKQKAVLGGEVWNPQWDIIVEDALPASMLTQQVPRDVRRFCPRFYRMTNAEKRAFWAYFFQALAGAEAGLNPTSHVRHVGALDPIDPVTHHSLHCEGLLQLAYEDAPRYGCDFDWAKDKTLKPGDPARTILQPKNNLECGVKILTHQIIDQHEPLFTARSYWATLRPGTLSYRIFARQMVSPPEACGYPGRTRRILDWVVADSWRFRMLRASR